MELTREFLTEIVKSLRSNSRAGIEKRGQPRVGMRLKLHMLRRPFLGEPIAIWVRDVSAGGIGALSDEAFQPKDDVKLIFADSDTDPVPCIVTYCRRVGASQYQLGLRFDAEADSMFG
jgi:PilZ domain-containing protein